MYCRDCGKKNEEEARFCVDCGSPMSGLPNVEEESAPTVQVQDIPVAENTVSPVIAPVPIAEPMVHVPVVPVPATEPMAAEIPVSAAVPIATEIPAKKKRKVWPFVVGGVAAIAAALVLAGFFMWKPILRAVSPEVYLGTVLAESFGEPNGFFAAEMPDFGATMEKTTVYELAIRGGTEDTDINGGFSMAFDEKGKRALLSTEVLVQDGGAVNGLQDFGLYLTPEQIAFDARELLTDEDFVTVQPKSLERELRGLFSMIYGTDDVTITDMDVALRKVFGEGHEPAPDISLRDVGDSIPEFTFSKEGTTERNGQEVFLFRQTISRVSLNKMIDSMQDNDGGVPDLSDWNVQEIAPFVISSGHEGLMQLLGATITSLALQSESMGTDPFDSMLLASSPSANTLDIKFTEDMVLEYYVSNEHKLSAVGFRGELRIMGTDMEWSVMMDLLGKKNPMDEMVLTITMAMNGEEESLIISRSVQTIGDIVSVEYSLRPAERNSAADVIDISLQWDKKSGNLVVTLASDGESFVVKGHLEIAKDRFILEGLEARFDSYGEEVVIALDMKYYHADSDEFFKGFDITEKNSVDLAEMDTMERMLFFMNYLRMG